MFKAKGATLIQKTLNKLTSFENELLRGVEEMEIDRDVNDAVISARTEMNQEINNQTILANNMVLKLRELRGG